MVKKFDFLMICVHLFHFVTRVQLGISSIYDGATTTSKSFR